MDSIAIRCTIYNPDKNNANNYKDAEKSVLWFHREEGKKSSHILRMPTITSTIAADTNISPRPPPNDVMVDSSKEINHVVSSNDKLLRTASQSGDETYSTKVLTFHAPCHLLLECISHNDPNNNDSHNISDTQTKDNTKKGKDEGKNSKKKGKKNSNVLTSWTFGGMELVSNSRNVECYGVDTTTLKEEYWKTCRGTPDESWEEVQTSDGIKQSIHWHRTIIIPPSSQPTPVMTLRLQLLGLRPARCKSLFLGSIKIKGILPDPIPELSTLKIEDNTSTLDHASQSESISQIISHPSSSSSPSKDQDIGNKGNTTFIPGNINKNDHASTIKSNNIISNRNTILPLGEAQLGSAVATMATLVSTTKTQIVSELTSKISLSDSQSLSRHSQVLERLDKLESSVENLTLSINHLTDVLMISMNSNKNDNPIDPNCVTGTERSENDPLQDDKD